ncbi:hypothetical protein [Microvirga thermotolerans]|uniref:Uncharacterized protein n=1 Tax=Microvirga thermotolerans TaxID=2651334 RepID=A0A5P9K1Y0_9HYPH|nr:hypothetical protein [Microvirga thermotolerans]QFU17700.1 hypothetical protein GDR74_16590 [Microvirga thermotolerans]
MLHRVTLHLARCSEFPEGSVRHGYEIVAPLDPNGYLEAAEWRERRNLCRVRRFWGDEAERSGFLVHRAGGAGGASWIIDYDRRSTSDDEAGYRLSKHRFVPGEYVSIQDDEDRLHTFQVATVQRVNLAGATMST